MSKLSDLNLKLGDKIKIKFLDEIGGESIYVISQTIDTFSPETAKNTTTYVVTQEDTNETFSITDEYNSKIMQISWYPELAQDVAAFHHIDAEAELTAILSNKTDKIEKK